MCLGKRKPKPWKRALPTLHTADGTVADSRRSLDDFWLDYFNTLEMGETRDTHAFLTQACEVAEPYQQYEPSITTLLNLGDIEAAFRTCKRRKSPGLDQMPGDVLLAFPALFAGVYQPLFNKAILRVQQPVQWRGGVLAEAFKNSGSPSLATSYRALFVSSSVGKIYHKAIRAKLISPAEKAIGSLHYGARRGASVVHVSQALVLRERANAAQGCSTRYLYLDTKSAYYAIVRQLA